MTRPIYVVSMGSIFHFLLDFHHNQSYNPMKTDTHFSYFFNISLSFLDDNVDEQRE